MFRLTPERGQNIVSDYEKYWDALYTTPVNQFLDLNKDKEKLLIHETPGRWDAAKQRMYKRTPLNGDNLSNGKS